MFSAKICGYQFDTMFGLYLTDYEIPAPEAKTNYIDIPGRNGALDKTERNGVVYFKDRTIPLEFQKTGQHIDRSDIYELEMKLLNAIHGKRGQLIFDEDVMYYWEGRFFVTSVSCQNNGLLIVQMQAVVDPFKYPVKDTTHRIQLSETAKSVLLFNGRKPVVPTVKLENSNSSAVLTWSIEETSYTKTISNGTYLLTDLILFDGETLLSASGSGTLTITYRMAQL